AADRLSSAGVRASERIDVGAVVNLLGRASGLRPLADPRRSWDLIRQAWSMFEADRGAPIEPVVSEAMRSAEASGDERAMAHAEMQHGLITWLMPGEWGPARLCRIVARGEPRRRARG